MFKTRIAALLIALIMIVCAFAGCSKEAASVMTFRNNTIDENEYCYMLSNYKAIYLYNLFGLTSDNAQLWQTEMTEGVTVDAYLSALANSTVMQTVLYLGLFDEYGLSLTNEDLTKIDTQIDTYITSAGSKAALNNSLAQYGANVETLRSIIIDTLKISKLKSYLYGDNGVDLATAAEIDAYYQENYMCTKLIFISATKDYEYDENGEYLVDESTNSYVTRDLTEEEKVEKKALFDDVKARVEAGEDFEALMKEYTMSIDMLNYEDGYYLTANSTFLDQDVMTKLAEMEIGAIDSVETEVGWFIIKRCPLRDGAYADSKYTSVMFSDMIDNIHNKKLQSKIEVYVDEVVVNKDITALYPISACTPNFSILSGNVTG